MSGSDEGGITASAAADTRLNRRGLLLAASGLFLPSALLEEAEADNHPVRQVQHRKDQRRHKRRHDLEQHRRQRRKSASKPPNHGGPKGFLGIELRVTNWTSSSINVAFYVADHEGHARIELAETRTLAKGAENVKFQTSGREGQLWINDRYCIKAYNPILGTPEGTLGYGGRIDAFGWHDGTTVAKDSMREAPKSDSLAMKNIDGRNFVLWRLKDTDDHKIFELIIDEPPRRGIG